MEKNVINKISDSVYQKFPDMKGSQLKIEENKRPGAKSINPKDETFLLTYKSTAKDPLGRKIPRWVRVIANTKGKILRISTSR